MALLVVAAQFSGRLYNSRHALVFAAGIMALMNPRIVIWDVGFQLSVAATLGVLYAYQLKNEGGGGLLESARPTIGAIIATAPLVAFHFQTFSTVALPANFLLLPLVPWVMLFGALSFLPFIGQGFSLVANIISSLMLSGTKLFASLPFSSLNIKVSGTEVFIIYAVIFLCLQAVLFRRRNKGVAHRESS